MLGSGLMAWLWALAAAQAIWPVLLACVWSWHLWRLWRDWGKSGETILLQWHAPPTSSWRVQAWGDVPVTARSVWEGQGAWLMHLRTHDGEREAWLWVRDKGERDIHRLRTLLSLPQRAMNEGHAPVA